MAGMCAPSVCFMSPRLDALQMGDVFLKNAYFSTDVAKNTVTLAKLV